MQFTVRRLLILTAIVACMFSYIGRYWPLGTAVAVVVCVTSGLVLLAFGSVKSWKLVVWTAIVFLGSLVSIRYALNFQHTFILFRGWSERPINACVMLAGALLSGVVAAVALAFLPRRPNSKAPPEPPETPAT